MKVLVTGGAGFIGSNLSLQLEKNGHSLTIIDNFSVGNAKNLRGFKGEVLAGDVTDKELVMGLPKYDAIIHEASITDTTFSDDREMFSQNVEGFRNVLSHALKCRAKVVFASSAGVYGNSSEIPYKEDGKCMPLNAYAKSKLEMEKEARKFSAENNLPIAALRYFNVYGPGESYKGKSASMVFQLYQQIKAGQNPKVFKMGEQERDQVYVKDVVKGTILAMEKNLKGFNVFNIASGKSISFNFIIQQLQKNMGTKFRTEYLENPYSFYQNHTLADISMAEKMLSYKPDYHAEKGIKDYVKSLDETGGKK